MKIRKIIKLPFLVLMLFLVAGSCLARESQPNEAAISLGGSSDPAVNAAWFNSEIDTTDDTGEHPSITIDHDTGTNTSPTTTIPIRTCAWQ